LDQHHHPSFVEFVEHSIVVAVEDVLVVEHKKFPGAEHSKLAAVDELSQEDTVPVVVLEAAYTQVVVVELVLEVLLPRCGSWHWYLQ
jgi:hypothetical protein